ncbi:SubName: Full=Uncharacterized protein {ECO:0000313/EMBL:CCA71024.1} [Serendipita indica DSM 11827]|nr:SubName: Full=Uncharacterized protein {ECO:0000313/EMBL:CCA71024.1} [Serendipita indica DSM 11827]
MHFRPPIPSFGELEDDEPAGEVSLPDDKQQDYIVPGTTGYIPAPRTPPLGGARALNPTHLSGPASGHDDWDDKVTPKAYTSHVPMVMRTNVERKSDANNDSPMLTSLLPPRTPRRILKPRDTPQRGKTIPTPNGEGPSVLARLPHKRAASLATDFLPHLPNGSSQASSLAPSIKFKSPSHRSHTQSETRVLDPVKNLHCSIDFPPTEHTNLILIANDRNIEFHVESTLIFNASPVLADIISPLQKSRKEGEEVDVFALPETYESLDAIVRFSYPKSRKPLVRSMGHLKRLLNVCKTYEIVAGMHNLSVVIVQFAGMMVSGSMDGSPLECYALACEFGFPNIAKLVSTHCLYRDPLKSGELGMIFANVASRDIRRLFELHHSRGLAAIALVGAAVDANELWCDGCSGVASWYEYWREAATFELKSRPVSKTIFSPSFIAGCLKQAVKKCPTRCLGHYLSPKTQLRFAVLQKSIDALKDRI